MVVACCGLVGGLEARFPSLRSENLKKPMVFPGFRGGQGNREHAPRHFGLSLLVLCFLRFWAQNLKKTISVLGFSKSGFRRLPKELVYYINKR